MKTMFLLFLSFIFFSTTSYSQSGLILGVEGGMNLSNEKYTGDFSSTGQSYSRKFGYQGGAKVGFKYKSFSILSGVQYVKLGGKNKVERNDPNNPWVFEGGTADLGTRSTSVDYSVVEIPLLLRYETSGKLRFSVAAGLGVNLGIGNPKHTTTFNLTLNGEQGPFESEYSFGDIGKDLYNKSFVSFHFSPGIIYQLNDNGFLTINAVVESSGKVRNPNSVEIYNGTVYKPSGSIKTNSIRFQIGYEHRLQFNIGTKY